MHELEKKSKKVLKNEKKNARVWYSKFITKYMLRTYNQSKNMPLPSGVARKCKEEAEIAKVIKRICYISVALQHQFDFFLSEGKFKKGEGHGTMLPPLNTLYLSHTNSFVVVSVILLDSFLIRNLIWRMLAEL